MNNAEDIIIRYVYKDTQTGRITLERHTIFSIAFSQPSPEKAVGYNVIIDRNRDTGLTDKKGIRIFEGDIIRECTVGSIIWDDMGIIERCPIGDVVFIPPYINVKSLRSGLVKLTEKAHETLKSVGKNVELHLSKYDGLYQWPKDIEVIGNIYKNPELIEDKDEDR